MTQEWGRRHDDNRPYPKTRGKEALPRGLTQVVSSGQRKIRFLDGNDTAILRDLIPTEGRSDDPIWKSPAKIRNIRTAMFVDPIEVDLNNEIIEGNHRWYLAISDYGPDHRVPIKRLEFVTKTKHPDWRYQT